MEPHAKGDVLGTKRWHISTLQYGYVHMASLVKRQYAYAQQEPTKLKELAEQRLTEQVGPGAQPYKILLIMVNT